MMKPNLDGEHRHLLKCLLISAGVHALAFLGFYAIAKIHKVRDENKAISSQINARSQN